MKRDGCPVGFKKVNDKCVKKVDKKNLGESLDELKKQGYDINVKLSDDYALLIAPERVGRAFETKVPGRRKDTSFKHGSADKLLKQAFDKLSYRHHGREAFRILIDLLGDQEGLTKTKYKDYRKQLQPLLRAFRYQAKLEPRDYLGGLVTNEDLGSETLCQNFTPTPITQMMAAMTLGDKEKLRQRQEPFIVLEPAMGTGAMAVEVEKYVPHDAPLVLHGVELDPLMYRGALINMRMFARHPYRLLCGDTLKLDLNKPEVWKNANKWEPPDLSKYYYGGGR